MWYTVSSSTATSLPHHHRQLLMTTTNPWVSFCSEQQEKGGGELNFLPHSRTFPESGLGRLKTTITWHSSFYHQWTCGKWKKNKLAVCVVKGYSHVQNAGRVTFKELHCCTQSMGRTFTTASLWAVKPQLVVGWLLMPRFFLVSSMVSSS